VARGAIEPTEALLDYLATVGARTDEVLERVRRETATMERAGMQVSPTQGALLELLARAIGARAILELGTLAGYSTLWLARALPPDGRLVTLEANASYAEVARANLAGDERIELIVGDALEALPALTGPFDLVFLDADKARNPDYLPWGLKLTRPGALIVADNVVRAAARGERRFLELVAAEPRLRATVIQTVGAKGYDGFALAVRVR